MTSTPWWKDLPEGFNLTEHVTDLDESHPLKVRGSAAMDVVLRTGLATAVGLAMLPNLLSSRALRRDLELLEFYKGCADRGDRSEALPRPPRDVQVRRIRRPLMSFQPEGVNCELLGFASPYTAVNPDLRQDYARHHQCHQVIAQHWRHPDGPRPTLIFTHGFAADAFWLNSVIFSLRWLYGKGYDILLYKLPFHGARAGRYDWFSGYGYFAHGLAHMNEAFLQGVYDLRIWIDYLEQQGAPAIGVSGYSLGGYTSALAAACDDRLAFAIPNAPAVILMDMILEWAPLGWISKQVMAKHRLGLTDLRHATAVHCPLTWAPAISADRLLIIGGAGDRFTSPRYVNALHEHWAGSQMHWFPGNHVVHLHQPQYLRLMKRFMDECCAKPRLTQ